MTRPPSPPAPTPPPLRGFLRGSYHYYLPARDLSPQAFALDVMVLLHALGPCPAERVSSPGHGAVGPSGEISLPLLVSCFIEGAEAEEPWFIKNDNWERYVEPSWYAAKVAPRLAEELVLAGYWGHDGDAYVLNEWDELWAYWDALSVKHRWMERERRRVTKAIRSQVLDRDEHLCRECGANTDLTIDHIVPLWDGGTSDESNLRTLCRGCNSRKGDRAFGG